MPIIPVFTPLPDSQDSRDIEKIEIAVHPNALRGTIYTYASAGEAWKRLQEARPDSALTWDEPVIEGGRQVIKFTMDAASLFGAEPPKAIGALDCLESVGLLHSCKEWTEGKSIVKTPERTYNAKSIVYPSHETMTDQVEPLPEKKLRQAEKTSWDSRLNLSGGKAVAVQFKKGTRGVLPEGVVTLTGDNSPAAVKRICEELSEPSSWAFSPRDGNKIDGQYELGFKGETRHVPRLTPDDLLTHLANKGLADRDRWEPHAMSPPGDILGLSA